MEQPQYIHELQVLKKKVKLMEEKLIELGQGQFLKSCSKKPFKAEQKQAKSDRKCEKLFQNDKIHKYALKLAYVGTNYYGLEQQPDVQQTIEAHLFKALEKLKLIKNRDECCYNRAGRTDKGVSALGNVVSIKLRQSENMCININRLLPDDIKIIDSCEVPDTFNARYDCIKRCYKYYFFSGTLDIDKMKEGCQYFLGENDFRNFCKLDVIANQHFFRYIYKYEIEEVEDQFQPQYSQLFQNDPRFKLYCATIEGNAFLWHQIRCMMQVLFHVGRGDDEPDVVQKLLKSTLSYGKPQYDLAPDNQLVLNDVIYPEGKIQFTGQQSNQFLMHLYEVLKKRLCDDYIKQFFLNRIGQLAIGQRLQETQEGSIKHEEEKKLKKVKSLLIRKCGPSADHLVQALKGRRKEMYEIKMTRLQEYETKVNDKTDFEQT